MSLSFVAIDFETANQNASSACSVGLTKVLDSQIVDSYYSLINPEEPFDRSNIRIHGIQEEDVQHAPNMANLSTTLFQFIGDLPLVAHNAGFDMRVLQSSLSKYNLDCPKLSYFCSLVLSRSLLQLPSYRLNAVADNYQIHFRHHRASDDATVCAEIVLNMFRDANVQSLSEMIEGLHYRMGRLYPHSYISFAKKRTARYPQADFKPSEIVAQTADFNPDHPFYQRVFVFSGELRTMSRKEACQKVANLGGINGNNVTKKTNFLVIGDMDFRLLRGHTKSSKMKKAELLAEQGQDIRIISESDFLEMLRTD
ncbi:MAG: exonuclease domain-containing protein [Sporolactobacillus sp.]